MILYMYIAPGQGQTAPRGQSFDVYRNVLSLHSEICCKLQKNVFEVWFYTNFFMIEYLYIIPGQGQTAPGDKISMSTERPYHFTYLLQVSKKSLWSLILYNFFHDLIHVYSTGAGGIQTPGDKVLMSIENSCHFGHLLLVSNHRRQ